MSSQSFRSPSPSMVPNYDGLSTRPPTYASFSASPTYVLDITSEEDPYQKINAWRGSVQSNGLPVRMLDDQSQDMNSVYDSPTDEISPVFRDLYYRVYTQDGAVQSKHSVYANDASLGRINANWVTPPHTAASIKRFLSKEEQISSSTCASLFSEISSTSALDDNVLVPILTGTGPGSCPGEPLALVVVPAVGPLGAVKPSKKIKPNPETARASISGPAWLSFRKNDRPVTSKGPQGSPSRFGSNTLKQPDSTDFRKKVRAKFNVNMSDPSWLSYKKGDILFTDGLQRLSGPNKLRVLFAQNSTGVFGYVYNDDVDVL